MDNNLALVPITAWCQTGGKPLAEPKITKDCVSTVKVSERSTVYSEYGWIFSASEDFDGHGIITRNVEVDPRLISEQNMHHHWIKSYWFNCYESRLYQLRPVLSLFSPLCCGCRWSAGVKIYDRFWHCLSSSHMIHIFHNEMTSCTHTRWPMDSPHIWPVMWKAFPFYGIIMLHSSKNMRTLRPKFYNVIVTLSSGLKVNNVFIAWIFI